MAMEKVVYGHSELDPTGQVKPAFRPIIPKVIKVVAVHWRILMIASSMSAVLSFLLMAPPILIGVIIDRAILGENRHLLILLSWGLIGSAVAICLVSLVQGYFLTLLAERIVNSVRVMLFEALQRQSYRFYLNTNSGAVESRNRNTVGSYIWVVRSVRRLDPISCRSYCHVHLELDIGSDSCIASTCYIPRQSIHGPR